MHWIWKVLLCLNLVGLIWTYLTVAAVWQKLQKVATAQLEVAKAAWAIWSVVQIHHDILERAVARAEAEKAQERKPLDPNIN